MHYFTSFYTSYFDADGGGVLTDDYATRGGPFLYNVGTLMGF